MNATLHSYGYGFMSQDSPNQTVLNDLCWGDDRKNNSKKLDPSFWKKEPLPYLPSNHFKLIEVYLRKKSQTQLVLQKLMTSFGPGIGRKSFFLMKKMGSIGCLVLLVAWYGMSWAPWVIFPPFFGGWFLWWIVSRGGDSPNTEVHYQTPRNFPWNKKHLTCQLPNRKEQLKAPDTTGGLVQMSFPFGVRPSTKKHLPKPAGFYPQNKKFQLIIFQSPPKKLVSRCFFVQVSPTCTPTAESPPQKKKQKNTIDEKHRAPLLDPSSSFPTNKRSLLETARPVQRQRQGRFTLTGRGAPQWLLNPGGFQVATIPPENQRLRTENGTLSWRWTQFDNHHLQVPY